MRYCPFCQNICEDNATCCSVCGNVLDPHDPSVTSSGLEPTLPIWVTQKTDLPLDSLLKEDDLWDDSDSDNSPSLQDENLHSYEKTPETDIFDEIAESVSVFYSNMPPKLKKFLLITLITTLLSIIPFIYASCTHQANPLDSISQIIAPTIQNSDGAAVP